MQRRVFPGGGRAFLLTFLLAVLVPAACGPGGGEAGRPAGERDFSFASGGKVSVPGDFPGDVPLPPGSRLLLARREEDGRTTLTLADPAAAGEVEDYIRGEVPERGWRLAGEAQAAGSRYFRYEKRGRVLVVVLSPEEEGTVVSLVHETKE